MESSEFLGSSTHLPSDVGLRDDRPQRSGDGLGVSVGNHDTCPVRQQLAGVREVGGDHRNTSGDRVDQHNATGPASAAGIPWTAHNDAPLMLPDAMAMVASAVNRTTASGAVLAAEVASTPFAALQAITVNAARQCFEEQDKGTLEVGKLADLVVLDGDPLEVDPSALTSISVVATYKSGQRIHAAE